MSRGRRIAFRIGQAIDRSGLPALLRRIFTALYTLYSAKDLGSFGRGSSISPWCDIEGAENIHFGTGTHVRSGCLLQATAMYAAALGSVAPPQQPVLRIGDGTQIGRYCHITAKGRIEIGVRVLMGERILIADHDHGFEDTTTAPRDQPLTVPRPVVIGDSCWIGDGAAILAGATLGRHVVVGANAVVRGEVAPFTVVVGNPARPVRRYDEKLGKWVSLGPLKDEASE
ncbi:MAG: acyltransferase [Deltaproteobacteria bacterium]|nr:acyltransferase [Deltaproteobacteria bacterium]